MGDVKRMLERQAAEMEAAAARPSPENIEPLHDWVLVRQRMQGRTEGGLFVPERAQNANEADGIVVAVGEGAWQNGVFVKPVSKVGDQVMCDLTTFFRMPANPDHILVRDGDIIARRKPTSVLQ
jgi:co-chaperonin GroES (HSP10)